jgi:hypothetical protein
MNKRFKMGDFSLTTRRYKCGCWYRDLDENTRVVTHCAHHKSVLQHLRAFVKEQKESEIWKRRS